MIPPDVVAYGQTKKLDSRMDSIDNPQAVRFCESRSEYSACSLFLGGRRVMLTPVATSAKIPNPSLPTPEAILYNAE